MWYYHVTIVCLLGGTNRVYTEGTLSPTQVTDINLLFHYCLLLHVHHSYCRITFCTPSGAPLLVGLIPSYTRPPPWWRTICPPNTWNCWLLLLPGARSAAVFPKQSPAGKWLVHPRFTHCAHLSLSIFAAFDLKINPAYHGTSSPKGVMVRHTRDS